MPSRQCTCCVFCLILPLYDPSLIPCQDKVIALRESAGRHFLILLLRLRSIYPQANTVFLSSEDGNVFRQAKEYTNFTFLSVPEDRANLNHDQFVKRFGSIKMMEVTAFLMYCSCTVFIFVLWQWSPFPLPVRWRSGGYVQPKYCGSVSAGVSCSHSVVARTAVFSCAMGAMDEVHSIRAQTRNTRERCQYTAWQGSPHCHPVQ